MGYETDLNNYMKAIKSNKIKMVDIKPAVSERKQVMLNQKKTCAICKKAINPVFAKYIRDPNTKVLKLLCSDCAIPDAKKRG